MDKIEEKIDRLKALLKELGGVVIGYSGGVDSTFLAAVGKEVLGDRCIAVLASSETYPSSEVAEAVETAEKLGLNLIQIHTCELENENFAQNTPERCFYCKTELFSKLRQIALDSGVQWIADGSNVDDLQDFRPGSRAADDLGVRSPLKEAGFTKDEIRQASKEMGLPTWDKPSFACLSSRIPYGVRIEMDILTRLDKAEQFLKSLGFKQVRVRHHGDIARIEVEPEDIERLVSQELRKKVVVMFEKLGYTYTTIDMKGYRTGSMNAVLSDAERDANER
jgi:pyridinium-3,5-biscarboxylic acid mononucleotide sulfurtransferase